LKVLTGTSKESKVMIRIKSTKQFWKHRRIKKIACDDRLDTVKGGGVKQIEDTTLNHHLNMTTELADEIIKQLIKQKEG
jgi:hypothetical protein